MSTNLVLLKSNDDFLFCVLHINKSGIWQKYLNNIVSLILIFFFRGQTEQNMFYNHDFWLEKCILNKWQGHFTFLKCTNFYKLIQTTNFFFNYHLPLIIFCQLHIIRPLYPKVFVWRSYSDRCWGTLLIHFYS